VPFLVDAQLPPALARFLTAAGHQAEHVVDLGLERAPDREIWSKAIDFGSAIITKDEDFLTLRALRSRGPRYSMGADWKYHTRRSDRSNLVHAAGNPHGSGAG
jgi:predicted nuclease of predicted toxin-antitoxin system